MEKTPYERRAYPGQDVIRSVAYHIWGEKKEKGIPSSPEENWREAKERIRLRATES